MTKQEAIEAIEKFRSLAHGHAVLAEALDMAIEALSCSEEPNRSDVISRQDAIDVAKQHWYKPDIAKALGELPSAQPERKGEWILAEDGWYCSVCELYPPFDCDPEEKGIPYCPNCGADMRGEKNV